MKAEALIELGQVNEALPLINQVRERAVEQHRFDDGSYTSNNLISKYRVRRELYLEPRFSKSSKMGAKNGICDEGMPFLDLVRWESTATTMNTYYSGENQEKILL